MRKLPFPLEKQSIVSKLSFFKILCFLTSFSLFFSDDRAVPSNSRPTVNIGLLQIDRPENMRPAPPISLPQKDVPLAFNAFAHCGIEKWPLNCRAGVRSKSNKRAKLLTQFHWSSAPNEMTFNLFLPKKLWHCCTLSMVKNRRREISP